MKLTAFDKINQGFAVGGVVLVRGAATAAQASSRKN
jgi:hypothetical protein